LIGGIGPASTELYYRALVRSHAAAQKRLSLTIVNADAREMIDNLEASNAAAQAEIFAHYVNQLKAGGCEAFALTSMGGHFCIEPLRTLASLPVISAIDALNAYFGAAGVGRVGVLGTRAVMDSGLYGVTAVEVIAPRPSARDAVHRNYTAIALAGAATNEQRDFFQSEALRLYREEGAEIIVLGGTDLFLAFDQTAYDYPVADCGLIHAEAIAEVAMDRRRP
jgi:aspartate racemase